MGVGAVIFLIILAWYAGAFRSRARPLTQQEKQFQEDDDACKSEWES